MSDKEAVITSNQMTAFSLSLSYVRVLLSVHCIPVDIIQQSGHSTRVSEQCFTSPPTQYRLYGRRFLQVKRPNQQYQSTEGDATKKKENNENN